MALQEYAYISLDHGQDPPVEVIRKFRVLESTDPDVAQAVADGKIRPVTRTNATIDPLTQALGPEVVDIQPDAVTITRAAVSLPAATVKAKRRQIARDEVAQTPQMNRELAQTIALVRLARLADGDTIPAALAAAYVKAKPWLEHWALAEVEAIRAANAGEDPTIQPPPAEDLP